MKKRLISFLLMVVMLVSLCSVIPMSASADAQVTTVTVASGDTVLSLCQKLGVDFYTYKDLIMKLNGFTSESAFNKISVGAKISLPISNQAAASLAGSVTTAAGTTAATGTSAGLTTGTVSSLPTGDYVAYYLATYTVQNYDTLSSIYSNWGLSYKTYENQIVKINNLSSVNSIKAGKTLLLPTTNPSIPGASYTTVMAHAMKSGESAYNIVCADYGLNYNSVEAMLKALNNRTNMGSFRIGELMYIPVAGVVSANTTVTPGTSGGMTSSTTGTVSTSGAYNLVSQTPTNGSFDLQVNGKSVKSATAGQTVNIVAAPDTGYAVDTVSVTKVGDSSVSVSVSNSSFVMPSYSVTVNVTFKQAKQSKITVDEVSNGAVSVMVDNSSVNKAYAGNKVTVRTTPKTGFMLDHVRVTYNDYRDSIAVENNVFTMPNFDVTVTAVFKIDPDYNPSAGSKIFTEVENATITAKVGEKTVDSAKKGERVTLTVTPKDNYVLESIKVYYDNFKKTLPVDNMAFTMPGEPVTVVAVVKPTADATFALNIVENSEGKIKLTVDGKEVTSAKAGQTVKVEGSSSKAFYNYLTTVTKVGDSSTVINLGEGNTFTMPAYAVNVSVKFYIYHNIVIDNSNGTNGYFNVTAALTGQQITRCGAGVELNVNVWGVKEGMSQGNIILTYSDGSTYTLTDTTKFVMPDCDVRVRVEFAKNVKLVAHSIGDDVRVYKNWGNTYTVLGRTLNDKGNYPLEIFTGGGNTVTVTPAKNIGYELDKIWYSYNGTDYEVEYNNITGKYQFVLPESSVASRVDLYVTFKEMARHAVTIDYGKNPGGTVELYTSLAAASEIAPKSLVWMRVYAKSGYVFDWSKVVIKNTKTGENVTNYVSFDPVTYRFTMPDYPVTVDLSNAFLSNLHTIYYKRVTAVDASGVNKAKGTIKLTIDNVTYENFSGYEGLCALLEGNKEKDVKAATGVIITHESEPGYYLDYIEVTGETSGESIKVTSVDGSTSYFTMPYESVIITPHYEDEFYAINAKPSSNGTYSVGSNAKMSKNDQNKLTDIKPDSGYRLGKVVMSYTADNGALVEKEVKRDVDGNYYILPDTLPKTAVTVEVTFEAMEQKGLRVAYYFDEGIVPSETNNYWVDLYVGEQDPDQYITLIRDESPVLTERVDVIDTDKSSVKTGDTVIISRHMENADERFYIKNIWVTYNGGKDAAYNFTNGQGWFVMPSVDTDKDCTIHVKFALKEELKYSIVGDITGAEVTVNGAKLNDGESIPVLLGTNVTVTVKALNDGVEHTPQYADIKVNGSTVVDIIDAVSAVDGTYTYVFGTSSSAAPVITSMPEGGSIELEVAYTMPVISRELRVNKGSESCNIKVNDTITANGAIVESGKSIVIALNDDVAAKKFISGVEIVNPAIEGASFTEYTVNESKTQVSFTMPETALNVSLTIEDIPAKTVPMTINASSKLKLNMDKSTNVAADGSAYTVAPSVNSGNVLLWFDYAEGTDTYDMTAAIEVKIDGTKLDKVDDWSKDSEGNYVSPIYAFNVPESAEKVEVSVTYTSAKHSFDASYIGDTTDKKVTYTRASDGKTVTSATSGEKIIVNAPEGYYFTGFEGCYYEKPAKDGEDAKKVDFVDGKSKDFVDGDKSKIWIQLGTLAEGKTIVLKNIKLEKIKTIVAPAAPASLEPTAEAGTPVVTDPAEGFLSLS